MTYAQDLRKALTAQLGAGWLVFMPKWDVQRRCAWQGKGRVPAGLMLHHTAACSGDKRGDNAGIIEYIQHKFEVPAASVTLDRDGRCFIHSAYPIWHAGVGTFKGKQPWDTLKVPDNQGNDYLAGVEIMSKGLRKDFTVAQQDSLVFLLRAFRDASGWDNIGLLRRPQHKTWTTRKIDTRYTDREIGDMILTYGFEAA